MRFRFKLLSEWVQPKTVEKSLHWQTDEVWQQLSSILCRALQKLRTTIKAIRKPLNRTALKIYESLSEGNGNYLVTETNSRFWAATHPSVACQISAQLQQTVICFRALSARLKSLAQRFRSIHKLLNWPRYSSEVISQTPLDLTVSYSTEMPSSSTRFWLHDRQRSNCWNCHVVEPNGEVDKAKSICSPWLLSVSRNGSVIPSFFLNFRAKLTKQRHQADRLSCRDWLITVMT